jgi:hypothetical protein
MVSVHVLSRNSMRQHSGTVRFGCNGHRSSSILTRHHARQEQRPQSLSNVPSFTERNFGVGAALFFLAPLMFPISGRREYRRGRDKTFSREPPVRRSAFEEFHLHIRKGKKATTLARQSDNPVRSNMLREYKPRQQPPISLNLGLTIYSL